MTIDLASQMHWARWGDPDRSAPLSEEARALVEMAFGPSTEQPTTPLVDVRLPEPGLPAALVKELAGLVGAENVLADHETRVRHTRGKSTPDLLRMRHGDGADAPDVVVLPADHAQVSAVVDWCVRRHVALVPFGGGTSVVGAADADGNTVVIVHSNSFPRYGSGIVVPDYDLVVSNRAGRGFSAVEGHPNFPASGRRPATTLHAWAFDCRDGADGSVMLGATHGGENQMPWNAQVLSRLLAGESPAMAMLAPLWRVGTSDDELTVESDLSDGDKRDLAAAGARCSDVEPWSHRSGFQLVTVGGNGPTAISDLRTIGAAAAW